MVRHQCTTKPCTICACDPFARAESKLEDYVDKQNQITNHHIIPHRQFLKIEDIHTLSFYPATLVPFHYETTTSKGKFETRHEDKTFPPRIELSTVNQQTFYIVFKMETDIEKMLKIIKKWWCSDVVDTPKPIYIEVLTDDLLEKYLPHKWQY